MKNYKSIRLPIVSFACSMVLVSLLASCASSVLISARLDIDQYTLNASASSLNFVSIKQSAIAESHQFTKLSGQIDNDTVAILNIDLNSVDTGIAIRDERMKQHLFNVSIFSQASISVPLKQPLIRSLTLGESIEIEISAILDLHGIEATVPARVSVVRKKDNSLMVSSVEPVFLSAEQFSFKAGIAKLQELAGLDSIALAVPVSFHLQYDPI